MQQNHFYSGVVAMFPIVRCVMVLACAGALAGCSQLPYRAEDFARVRKVDAHVHFNTPHSAPMQQARADGFEVLSINVDYDAFPPLATQAAVAHHLRALYPHRFHYATSFAMQEFDAPGWHGRTVAGIAREQARGAAAVKIWKNVGMKERNAAGQLIALDDAVFDPVVAAMVAARLPLISHQGEPRSCWHPIAQMPTATDRAYFTRHPEYHMFRHPELPPYEALMAAQDRFVSAHPALSFVGAHLASMESDLAAAAAFLDAHPNATMDLSARIGQLQALSVLDYDAVRQFFMTYQDRLIYGSDAIMNPGTDGAMFALNLHRIWLRDWRYLATNDVQFSRAIGRDVPGLALPRRVIDAIFYRNAVRVYQLRGAR